LAGGFDYRLLADGAAKACFCFDCH
jgi:hypothetical protein